MCRIQISAIRDAPFCYHQLFKATSSVQNANIKTASHTYAPHFTQSSSINGDRSDVEVVFVFAPEKCCLTQGYILYHGTWRRKQDYEDMRIYGTFWLHLILVLLHNATSRSEDQLTLTGAINKCRPETYSVLCWQAVFWI
ncbi:uncharacterized protein RAG0_03539 [Rhynchosporium agropyri]|uniref:Uncharacterized protein n=1 Tax=Rhynchosporium agropyri TaxID=914238 RepID=A0A1E1K4U8_9HELO|nr:uncharacterized protein RAG0_03539 [Rhynchosporium agropyri]